MCIVDNLPNDFGKSLPAVYIHIPFCRSKCPYCDFISVVGSSKLLEYLKLIKKEITLRMTDDKIPVKSIYFGGGTPSILNGDQMNDILSRLKRSFLFEKSAEITLEANPLDCDIPRLKEFHNLGINRISIGVQSFDDNDLKFLGRKHNGVAAGQSIINAYDSGFRNISIDLMYGFAAQMPGRMHANLKKAVALPITHISTYCLSIGKGTLFSLWSKKGKIISAADDISADIYQDSANFLESNKFYRYEISNFAKPGFESVHNINYWMEGEYFGFGLSASSYINGSRFKNTDRYREYKDKLLKSKIPVEYSEILNIQERMTEELILNLRLSKGVNWHNFRLKYSNIAELKELEKKIDFWVKHGFLAMQGAWISLIFPKGVLISDEIFSDLL